MKDHKRLTKRDEFGNADIIGVDRERLASNLDFNELNELTFALNKFADLEDKIESGEIDYVEDRKTENTKITEKEIIQKIYEVIKLVDCMQYNPSVDFNYLRAKGAYNIIKNRIEQIEYENTKLRATLSKMEKVENAVDLPCKVEDTVFTIFEDKIKEYKVTEIRFISNLLGNTWAISGYSIETNITLQLVDCHFKIWWFTDRIAAEARLAELIGGKQ